MRTVLLLSVALLPALALSQTTPQPTSPASRPRKILTPDQIAYQAAAKTYNAQADQLRATAAAALNAELAREHSPSCTTTSTTYDLNMCLAHEVELTNANYKVFTTALRSLLALPEPAVPGVTYPINGPSGPEATPATNTAAFDAAESAWQTYATAECGAVDTYWRGGTIVNSMVGECDLRLARARLQELDTLYSVTHPR